ncbi:hypothetical protein [Yinghuangia soli]|uniref:Uncharacterized protein n=1 Tax=Yinghuangia soli TaxID=2908204 RepID=A0AA41Q4N3_9ACTN|nr:hypothetical protein [Yinghuangia soli]MCF2530037.1 hypothetical protein [Yinghuangia soli]
MYLIHAQLAPCPGGALPTGTAALISAAAETDDGLEHTILHPQALPHPVLGLFVAAESLLAAEEAALRLCRRAARVVPSLAGITVVSCGAPLVPDYYERLLAATPGA